MHLEDVGHARHTIDIPVVELLVKAGGFLEHGAHIRDARGIPRADVVIEGGCGRVAIRIMPSAKQMMHVRHASGRPRRNMAIRRLCDRRIREPRRDGPSNFPVDHDVAREQDVAVASIGLPLHAAIRRRARSVVERKS